MDTIKNTIVLRPAYIKKSKILNMQGFLLKIYLLPPLSDKSMTGLTNSLRFYEKKFTIIFPDEINFLLEKMPKIFLFPKNLYKKVFLEIVRNFLALF